MAKRRPSLRPAGRSPAPPAGEASLNRELEALATTREAQLKRLREAQAPAKQAAASRALARAYRQSAVAAARGDLPADAGPEMESIAEALRRAGVAYRRLGAGAAGDDRPAYEAGRRAVRRAEGLLTRRLEANLNAAGAE